MNSTQTTPCAMQYLFLYMYVVVIVLCYMQDGIGMSVYGACALIAGMVTSWYGCKR